MSDVVEFSVDASRILALKPGDRYTTSPRRFELARKHKTVEAMLARPDVEWSSCGTEKTVTIMRQE